VASTVAHDKSETILSQQLLLSVAEQMKMPLMQIARRAELARLDDSGNSAEIQSIADAALRLVDSYALGVRLALQDEYALEIEPVSISSVLYDTGQQLRAMAQMYGVELELNIGGKYGPVMAHRGALQAALVSLGYALIEALPAGGSSQLRLQLATHRCRYGIVAGLYSDKERLTTEALRRGRQLRGRARQPLTGLTHTSGAGVFVADAILQSMHSGLKVSRHQHLYGLGAVLQPNPQIQLV
jgi:hypothetical protein